MKGKVMPTPHGSYTSLKHRCPESQQGDGDAIHLTRRSNVERRTWNVEAPCLAGPASPVQEDAQLFNSLRSDVASSEQRATRLTAPVPLTLRSLRPLCLTPEAKINAFPPCF